MQTQNKLETREEKTTDLSFLFMIGLLGIGFVAVIIFLLYSLFD